MLHSIVNACQSETGKLLLLKIVNLAKKFYKIVLQFSILNAMVQMSFFLTDFLIIITIKKTTTLVLVKRATQNKLGRLSDP